MRNYRSYGNKPYTVALIHGGPGAAGEMENFAKHLSASVSVIEPFQTQMSIQGLLDELKELLQEPIILVGYSWGAMLSLLFTYHNPTLVKKLILVGCPPLDAENANLIIPTRLSKLSSDDKQLFFDYFGKLESAPDQEKRELFAKIKKLIDKADRFNPEPSHEDEVVFQSDIYESVWPEAVTLRDDGVFLDCLKHIQCPITLIHGDDDPHPVKAVQDIIPFLKSSRLYILKKCGHTPWIEKGAKDTFYELLEKEISNIS